MKIYQSNLLLLVIFFIAVHGKRVYMCIDMNLQRDIGFDFFFLSVSRLHGSQMNVLQKTGLL